MGEIVKTSIQTMQRQHLIEKTYFYDFYAKPMNIHQRQSTSIKVNQPFLLQSLHAILCHTQVPSLSPFSSMAESTVCSRLAPEGCLSESFLAAPAHKSQWHEAAGSGIGGFQEWYPKIDGVSW